MDTTAEIKESLAPRTWRDRLAGDIPEQLAREIEAFE